MFSLIIVLISILLVALLAAAVIYYGGDSYNKGNAKAKAAEIINQAELIKGAFTVYKIELGTIEIDKAKCDAANGVLDGCLDPLVSKNYLTDIPQGADGWYIEEDGNNQKTLRRTLANDVKACAIANYASSAPVPQNPDLKSVNLESMKISDPTEFAKYVPRCSDLSSTSSNQYICCTD